MSMYLNINDQCCNHWLDGSQTLQPNMVYRVSVIYDRTRASIYMNATLEATNTVSQSHRSTIDRVTIGSADPNFVNTT
eukprot:COSAG01_NODE_60924_length_292_cov_0.761658_1_plen_77_part_10